MHELALIKNVVKSITEQLSAQGVTRKGAVKSVALKVGALELHGEESFRQMFAVESQGGVLEGANLELEVIPAVLKCPCGFSGRPLDDVDHHDPMPVAVCPKCGELGRLSGGRGVEGIELEVADQPQRRKKA
ncbi:MAG: hydrogenase maturation nickel metallochaperone HypA [Elusimicrobia bacterium]|nr:hydrogenase maturation nickel metallochaperone HypA [Elusimicrobiota bacterium]